MEINQQNTPMPEHVATTDEGDCLELEVGMVLDENIDVTENTDESEMPVNQGVAVAELVPEPTIVRTLRNYQNGSLLLKVLISFLTGCVVIGLVCLLIFLVKKT